MARQTWMPRVAGLYNLTRLSRLESSPRLASMTRKTRLTRMVILTKLRRLIRGHGWGLVAPGPIPRHLILITMDRVTRLPRHTRLTRLPR